MAQLLGWAETVDVSEVEAWHMHLRHFGFYYDPYPMRRVIRVNGPGDVHWRRSDLTTVRRSELLRYGLFWLLHPLGSSVALQAAGGSHLRENRMQVDSFHLEDFESCPSVPRSMALEADRHAPEHYPKSSSSTHLPGRALYASWTSSAFL